MMKETIIRNIPLFNGLPEYEILNLAKNLTELEVPVGTLIFREGDFGDYFLVVLSGEVEIIKEIGTPNERFIAVRQMGDHIGEMSLLRPGGTRSASARAKTDVTLLQITRADFDVLLPRHPIITYNMTRTLSNRLNEAHNHAIHDLELINDELRKAYDDLKAAQAQIIEKEKIEHELSVARKIQQSILPRQMPDIPGFGFSAIMVPTHAIGGDLFDFVVIDEKHVGLAIADVADKGIPSAIFMALTRSLLRAEALRSLDPSIVLQNVNRVLIDMNTEDMFVTVLYGIVNLETLQFNYVRAGHPSPLVARKNGQLIDPQMQVALPLALFSPVALDIQKIQLQRGDTLLLFTDGITDATDDQGHELGDDGLHKIFLDIFNKFGHPSCQDLMSAIDDFRQATPQNDDMTMVILNVL
jgi:phosphoserine phosphatase RsbU/P